MVQFAACGADEFWVEVNKVLNAGGTFDPPVPPLGMSALDGKPCMTTRDFALTDMDPTDNVVRVCLACYVSTLVLCIYNKKILPLSLSLFSLLAPHTHTHTHAHTHTHTHTHTLISAILCARAPGRFVHCQCARWCGSILGRESADAGDSVAAPY